MNFDFTINLNFAFAFLTFYSIRNKINAILLHTCRLYLLKLENDLTTINGDMSPFICAHL